MDSVKNTVPVYFLKRVAGEGRDMPRSMYNHAGVRKIRQKVIWSLIPQSWKLFLI